MNMTGEQRYAQRLEAQRIFDDKTAALAKSVQTDKMLRENFSSDDRVVHVAAAEVARLIVHARDRWGNRRAAPSAEDEFYVTVRPSGGAPVAAAADDEGCAVEARGDGSYAVTFSRRRAGTRPRMR